MNECNDKRTFGDDTDIRPSYDMKPMVETDQNAVECDDERVMLANLIANLKLDVDENKKKSKQLKKEKTSLAHELKECKSIPSLTVHCSNENFLTSFILTLELSSMNECNDKRTFGDDTDIRPSYDMKPMVEVPYTTEYNVFANERQHSEQLESISNTCVVENVDNNVIPDSPDMCDNDIQTDQNDVECDDERVMLANLIANLKLDFASQVGVSHDLTKPVTPHYWPQVRISSFPKPYDVNAPSPSRKSPKHVSFQSPNESVGSNYMVHNYYLEEAKKKAQL
nr:hypothetical protein [Tanacetum cinerariifolium]